MRTSGVTLVEMVVVLGLVGALCSIAIPRFVSVQHRLAARGAASQLTRALFDTRHVAWRRGTRVALRVDTNAAIVTVYAAADTFARYDLHTVFGVTLAATRDSVAYLPSGLGFGAANARFILARGAAAETVTVSRIGRVRR